VLLGLTGLFVAWDGWFALQEANDGVAIRTFRSLPRLDGGYVLAVIASILLASALLLSDRAARAGSALLGLTLATTMLWEQQTYSNHWVLVTTVSLLFALVPRTDATGTVPYWPVFLVRMQLASLYLWTGIAKLNPQYFTGRPLKWGTIDLIGSNTPEKLWVLISIGVVALELSLAFALWLPRVRGWALLLGTAMHLGIGLLGKGPVELVPFQLAVFAVYVLFATDPVPVEARRAAHTVA
jgi:hypothetical protein